MANETEAERARRILEREGGLVEPAANLPDDQRVQNLQQRAADLRATPTGGPIGLREGFGEPIQPVERGSGPAIQIGQPTQPGRGMQRAASALNGLTLGYADEGFRAIGAEGAADRLNTALDAHRERSPAGSAMYEIAGGILIPAGGAAKGASWLKSAAKATGLGALFGGTYAMGNAEGSVSERMQDLPGGIVGGALGGAASIPVASAVAWAGKTFGRAASRVLSNKRFFNRGGLTDAGRRALENAGLDPDNVSQSLQQHFARRASELASPEEAGRAAVMDEFGIPAYRHNVTGTVDDAAGFHSAVRGGSGSPALNERVRQAADTQSNAAQRAAETIATDISQGRAFDQGDAAAMAMDRLRTLDDETLQGARGAYETLRNAGGGVRGSAVAGMADEIKNAARIGGVEISETATPNAAQALRSMGTLMEGAERGSVPFMNLERTRQLLNRMRSASYRGSNGADQIAMDTVIRQFDDLVEDRIETAMIDGSEDVLQQARQARQIWSDYMNTFRGDDAASKFIQRMTDADASPDQAVQWMFSASKMGRGQMTGTIARGLKDILGEESDEWNAIRQAAFRQMAIKPEGTTQMGPQRVSENIFEFFNAPRTRDLSGALFTEPERAVMRRYAAALKQLVPPAGSVNYSGSGYEVTRRVSGLAQGVAGLLGFGATGGQPGWGLAAAEAAGAVGRAAEGARVSSMLRATPRAGASAAPAGGAVAGVATVGPLVNDAIRREQR